MGCFFFQAEDGIRDYKVTGVQTCALPICESLDDVNMTIEALGTNLVDIEKVSRRELTKMTRSAQILADTWDVERSEEHTSELQSPCNLVCRLLLEKKKNET